MKWIIEIPRGQRVGEPPLSPHYVGQMEDGTPCFTSRARARKCDTKEQAARAIHILGIASARIVKV
jgi:hypothetical protein